MCVLSSIAQLLRQSNTCKKLSCHSSLDVQINVCTTLTSTKLLIASRLNLILMTSCVSFFTYMPYFHLIYSSNRLSIQVTSHLRSSTHRSSFFPRVFLQYKATQLHPCLTPSPAAFDLPVSPVFPSHHPAITFQSPSNHSGPVPDSPIGTIGTCLGPRASRGPAGTLQFLKNY